ncbi:MAG: 5'-methylthioadenosine/adenosylhomocysteine nucleosidase [Coprobacillaceae bacterium]
MIGIIGAMQEEVEAIKEYMIIEEEKKVLDSHFYIGKREDKKVVLLQGGIGKVNAAICTTLLLLNYDVSYILNIGSAGGLQDNQEVGDIIISNGVIHHDVDVTAFGRDIGQVPGYPTVFLPQEALLHNVTNVLNSLHIKSHDGIIVSGDQFIATASQVGAIKKAFPNALCAEMEAAAIAQTCYKFNTPFIILRSLSDVYGKGESAMQFDEYLKIASKNSALLCKTLIKEH